MKVFPVLLLPSQRRAMPHCPRHVPWDLISTCEARAERNHRQSLDVLASRGGLDPIELLCVLNDQAFPHGRSQADYETMLAGAVAEVVKRCSAFLSAGPHPVAATSPGVVWPCTVCEKVNVIVGGPDRAACNFCKTVHLIPSPPEDVPTPNGAAGSPNVQSGPQQEEVQRREEPQEVRAPGTAVEAVHAGGPGPTGDPAP